MNLKLASLAATAVLVAKVPAPDSATAATGLGATAAVRVPEPDSVVAVVTV